VRSLTLASGAALASGSFTHLAEAWGREKLPEIAVIGGGLAGLSAAYWLKKAGLRATVYEARARLGGRVQSVSGAVGSGLVTDLGGSLINANHADMLALVKAFNLKLFNRVKDAERFTAPATAYFFEGQIGRALRTSECACGQPGFWEQLSDEYYGFMNGAAQTGRLAAQVILRREGFSKVLKV
jgi:monoamine oxidase